MKGALQGDRQNRLFIVIFMWIILTKDIPFLDDNSFCLHLLLAGKVDEELGEKSAGLEILCLMV